MDNKISINSKIVQNIHQNEIIADIKDFYRLARRLKNGMAVCLKKKISFDDPYNTTYEFIIRDLNVKIRKM